MVRHGETRRTTAGQAERHLAILYHVDASLLEESYGRGGGTKHLKKEVCARVLTQKSFSVALLMHSDPCPSQQLCARASCESQCKTSLSSS